VSADFPDYQEKYTFDLGDNMKANMMGIHGRKASQRTKQNFSTTL
jgi:hypothetical protein